MKGDDNDERSKPLDGKSFLDALRESGKIGGTSDFYDYSPDATLVADNRASNAQQRQLGGPASLQNLFEEPAPPPPPPPSTRLSAPPPAAAGAHQLSPRSTDGHPIPKPFHDRNVSWGTNVEHPASPASYFGPSPTGSAAAAISSPSSHPVQRPSLAKTTTYPNIASVSNTSHRREMSGLTNTETSSNSPYSFRINRKTGLSIDEVSPFEAEVETAILRALDNRSQRRLRSDTGDTSTLLSQVPSSEQVAHEFEVSSMDDPVEDNNGSGGGGANKDDSSRSDPQQVIRPLIAKRQKSRGHSRKESVEQTLFDLTVAMTAVHKRGKSKVQFSHSMPSSPSSNTNNAAAASAEEFAQNVVLLSDTEQQQQQQPGGGGDAESVASASGASRSRWGLIKENLPVLKENNNDSGDDDDDNDEANGGDFEMGLTSSDGSSDNDSSPDAELGNGDHLRNNRNHRKSQLNKSTTDQFKEDWQKWSEFFRPHKGRLFSYCKNVTLYLLVPLIGVAAILFYLAGNVPTGKIDQSLSANGIQVATDGEIIDEKGASASYSLLFSARQIVTLSMALAMQCVIIDVVALQTRFFLRTVGPVITLMIVQSKGWPHIVFWWSIWNFAMNYGKGAFAHHWAFYQDWIDLFNAANPSGSIPTNEWYKRCLVIGVSVSLVVTVKRFLVGLHLGRKQFSHFGEQLAKVMNKMFLLSEVAALGKYLEKTKGSEDKKPMSIPAE